MLTLFIVAAFVIITAFGLWCLFKLASLDEAIRELSQFSGEANEPPYMKRKQ